MAREGLYVLRYSLAAVNTEMNHTSVMMRLGGVRLRRGDDVESCISADDFTAAAAAAAAAAEVNGGGVFRPERFIQTQSSNS